MNLFDLTGNTAIVTGGNGGIGLGMALGLAEAGASVAVVGRNPEKTRAAAETIEQKTGAKALAIVADLSKPEEVERAVAEAGDHFGRIDALFNNAGINIRKAPQDFTLDEWNQVMNANVTSAFLASKAVYPWMKRQGGGKIVNTGSMTSVFGSSFAAAYATSKGAIVQLTKSLALAWAADQIQVNAILPGWFDTEMTFAAREQIPGLHERVLSRIAVGRWAKPDDMAGAAVFLASRASDYITGVALPVDGGYLATL
ncbi:SDR family NAD(P)-dependent oxidoreductase [Planctomyces sp. SH-PL62]|uniref:SDR family NAD(P)-dependent oxidoreductase n=1 Tax=Planctomyces sp. SH-PL62 TaxID=1636152 RepID=UPI00078C1B42|nr:glucose 1-dehydrogenase [Planctomyces sp. SH-PL62]AMV40057.1 2-dehydro-3-deoxy-D-gluconate 5-dehydrogenase [Planctomyces sp. SH-PL62]